MKTRHLLLVAAIAAMVLVVSNVAFGFSFANRSALSADPDDYIMAYQYWPDKDVLIVQTAFVEDLADSVSITEVKAFQATDESIEFPVECQITDGDKNLKCVVSFAKGTLPRNAAYHIGIETRTEIWRKTGEEGGVVYGETSIREDAIPPLDISKADYFTVGLMRISAGSGCRQPPDECHDGVFKVSGPTELALQPVSLNVAVDGFELGSIPVSCNFDEGFACIFDSLFPLDSSGMLLAGKWVHLKAEDFGSLAPWLSMKGCVQLQAVAGAEGAGICQPDADGDGIPDDRDTSVDVTEGWSPDSVNAAGGFEANRNAYTLVYDYEVSRDVPTEVRLSGPVPALPAVSVYRRIVDAGVAGNWISAEGEECPIAGGEFDCKFYVVPIFDFAAPYEVVVGAAGGPANLMNMPHSPSLLLSEYVDYNLARGEILRVRFPDLDFDGDGVVNMDDNCLFVVNPSIGNRDGDRWGNSCDNDIDHDGWLNAIDNCPYLSNPLQSVADVNLPGCRAVSYRPIEGLEIGEVVGSSGLHVGEIVGVVPGKEEEGEEVPGAEEEGVEVPVELGVPTVPTDRRGFDFGGACTLGYAATANPAALVLVVLAIIPMAIRRKRS